MPRRNATGVVCKFLNWGIDVVCMVLLSGQPLMVTCAGLSMSLVLVVVFLVVGDSSERKVIILSSPNSLQKVSSSLPPAMIDRPR